MSHLDLSDTIVALATPPGTGAIGVIRLSGKEAITIIHSVFKGKNLEEQPSHTVHFGKIVDGGEVLDEVVVTLFRGPHSYTKENVAEISCHGSPYILQKILELLLRSGARAAEPGEFTLRAYLNGRFDLSQAEAVADLIASDSQAAHRMAMQQMRGGISNKLKELRTALIDFAALLELELDFGEEDVEFADRSRLTELLHQLLAEIESLSGTFRMGNAIKQGIPVAIVGQPNAGKSTLLNTLLQEERAIVSDIAGTTRDTIEETMTIDGFLFRFIDTAGIRDTEDTIEKIGVQRSMDKIRSARIILHLLDATALPTPDALQAFEKEIRTENPEVLLLTLINKCDVKEASTALFPPEAIPISARTHEGIAELKARIVALVQSASKQLNDGGMITHQRHYEALNKAAAAIRDVLEKMLAHIPTDLIAQDVREAIRQIGNITGEIDTDKDILATIFGKFCIGK